MEAALSALRNASKAACRRTRQPNILSRSSRLGRRTAAAPQHSSKAFTSLRIHPSSSSRRYLNAVASGDKDLHGRRLKQVVQLAGGAAPDGLGFELEVARSTIPNSGNGVFVGRGCGSDGGSDIPAGTAVALYAGVYFPLPPQEVQMKAREDEVIVDSLRLMQLYGGGAVDDAIADASYDEVSSYWLILQEHRGVLDGFRAAARVGPQVERNPYAVGPLVNHPARGTQPNVVFKEFSWAAVGQGDPTLVVNRAHRGVWYVNPVTKERIPVPPPDVTPDLGSHHGPGHEGAEEQERGSLEQTSLPGVVFVALRDISPGEELFVDYKLSWPRPSWYSPVVPESSWRARLASLPGVERLRTLFRS
eukprot:TRINITY_DN36320_c0_g1_i4.p1 TRINITY_DN36320_c0_g1~~TRINITY_DN36320_c0_g1_i4.p1  ORF type:complete len:384 (+),score=51.52 TRINITY_DN36320_c0_g1_i4:69-1154(+)